MMFVAITAASFVGLLKNGILDLLCTAIILFASALVSWESIVGVVNIGLNGSSWTVGREDTTV